MGLELETSLEWLNEESATTDAGDNVRQLVSSSDEHNSCQSSSSPTTTVQADEDETGASSSSSNHSFLEALAQLEDHNRKLNVAYESECEPTVSTPMPMSFQATQQSLIQPSAVPRPMVKYISIDCLQKRPGEIRADLNKLITAANMVPTTGGVNINVPSISNKVLAQNGPKVLKIDNQSASFTKITQVVSSTRPTSIAKTNNVVYFDKTNNRFLPISEPGHSQPLSIPKIYTTVNPSSASNLNIKTTQRSVVTINQRFVSYVTQQPTAVTHPVASLASSIQNRFGVSTASVNSGPHVSYSPFPYNNADLGRFLVEQDEEVIVEEEDELGHAETYANYMPSKCIHLISLLYFLKGDLFNKKKTVLKNSFIYKKNSIIF